MCATLRHPDAHAALVHGLDDPDATVSGEASRHLAMSGDVTPILTRLEQAHPARFRWIAALGLAGNEQAVQPLIALYDTAQPHERITIAGALARLNGPDSVRFLTSRVGDPEVTIRRVAAEVVSGASNVELQVLEGLSRDSDWVVRKWAVRGLARLGPPQTRPLLLELARDIDDMVSEAARLALGHAVEPCS